MTIQVAVYGSLKRGFHNHPLLALSEYIGTFSTKPEFTMYAMDYFPAIIKQGKTAIAVEVFHVDRTTLAKLDELEGVPHFYERHEVDIPDAGKTWLYVLSEGSEYMLEHETIVASGCWSIDHF